MPFRYQLKCRNIIAYSRMIYVSGNHPGCTVLIQGVYGWGSSLALKIYPVRKSIPDLRNMNNLSP